MIKILYATNDGQVKEIVRRRPPPNRFTMSEQDVDDVAFLTGETARRSNAKQRIAIFLPSLLLFLSLLLFIFPFSFPPFLFPFPSLFSRTPILSSPFQSFDQMAHLRPSGLRIDYTRSTCVRSIKEKLLIFLELKRAIVSPIFLASISLSLSL